MKINRLQKYLTLNFAIILSIIMISCRIESKNNSELNTKNKEITDLTEAVFIIPEVGCGTCIANGIKFLKENENIFKENPDQYLIVFSNIHSLKMVKRSLNESSISIDSLNIVFDMDNRYELQGKHKLYPTVFYIKNKNVVKEDSQSPDNSNALTEFKKYLKK